MNNKLKCDSCKNFVKEIYKLKCFHNVCNNCYSKLLNKIKKTIKCNLCKKLTSLKSTIFKDNIKITSLNKIDKIENENNKKEKIISKKKINFDSKEDLDIINELNGFNKTKDNEKKINSEKLDLINNKNSDSNQLWIFENNFRKNFNTNNIKIKKLFNDINNNIKIYEKKLESNINLLFLNSIRKLKDFKNNSLKGVDINIMGDSNFLNDINNNLDKIINENLINWNEIINKIEISENNMNDLLKENKLYSEVPDFNDYLKKNNEILFSNSKKTESSPNIKKINKNKINLDKLIKNINIKRNINLNKNSNSNLFNKNSNSNLFNKNSNSNLLNKNNINFLKTDFNIFNKYTSNDNNNIKDWLNLQNKKFKSFKCKKKIIFN